MKKVLVSLIAVCLLFSGFVMVKSLTRNDPVRNAPLEALSKTESDHRYQSMGYCTDWELTYMCISDKTSEWCRIDCPVIPENN